MESALFLETSVRSVQPSILQLNFLFSIIADVLLNMNALQNIGGIQIQKIVKLAQKESM